MAVALHGTMFRFVERARPAGDKVFRMSAVIFGIAAAISAGACADSTQPANDDSLVTVELPGISVPLLAASRDRLFSLQDVSASTRELAGRSLDGEVKWTAPVPPCPSGLDCVLAVDESSNLFFNTNEGLMSRKGSNGELRWTASSIETPAVAISTSGHAFAVGRPGAATQLMYSVDGQSGTVTWATILPSGFDATAILLDEGASAVYAIGRGAVTALDPQTGGIKWTTSRNCLAGSDGALASDGTIYVTCDNDFLSTLYAYNRTGTEKWHVSLGSTPGSLTPLIDEAGTVYAANRGSVTAVNPSGTIAWRLTGLFRNGTHPVIDASRTVYVAASRISSVSGRYLYGINNGQVASDDGLLSCAGSLLLSTAGRLYCGEIGLIVYIRTAGFDDATQWSQIGRDSNHSSRR
jgi:outer membrane protein assembly factor BamB